MTGVDVMIKFSIIALGMGLLSAKTQANSVNYPTSELKHYEISYQESGSNHVEVKNLTGKEAPHFINDVIDNNGTIIGVDDIIAVRHQSVTDTI